MISGVTRSGFAFEVDEAVANDMELFEALCDLDNGDATAVVPVCRIILGKQKKALYDHLRRDNGTVPIEDVSDAIMEVIEALGDDGKN